MVEKDTPNLIIISSKNIKSNLMKICLILNSFIQKDFDFFFRIKHCKF